MKSIIAVATLAAAAVALGAPGPSRAANYEAVYVPGSPQVAFGFFRIDVTSGQVVDVFGASATYTPIPDSTSLPPGEYHLYLADQPATAAGAVSYSIVRLDGRSGRTWVLQGGGPTPFSWIEVGVPH